jgi:glutamyl-tRNA synthetase
LYNWLLARKSGGRFLVRIEDTDQKRYEPAWVDAILGGLAWLGLTSDEPPVYQSHRLDLYNTYFDKLLAAGRAYPCFCTAEQLDAERKAAEAAKRDFRYDGRCRKLSAEQVAAFQAEGRPSVLRFAMPGTDSIVEDLTFGTVRKAAGELDDFVIRKSDGFPTFHFAVVIDDFQMRITHVIRGKEHLENTHRHQAIQDALGLPRPAYCHLPIFVNPDNSKLSKRKDSPEFWAKGFPRIRVADYQAAGYLPEALINYLALLGWSPGDDRQIMSRAELIEAFSLDRVVKSDAKWSVEKLDWMNGQYLMSMDAGALLARLREYLAGSDAPAKAATDAQLAALLPLYRERMKTLADFGEKTAFFFTPDDQITFDPAAVKKVFKGDALALLAETRRRLAAMADWQAAPIDAMLAAFAQENAAGMGKIAQPIRVAVTGTTVSPGIGETLAVLGKERTLARIDRALATFAGGAGEHE